MFTLVLACNTFTVPLFVTVILLVLTEALACNESTLALLITDRDEVPKFCETKTFPVTDALFETVIGPKIETESLKDELEETLNQLATFNQFETETEFAKVAGPMEIKLPCNVVLFATIKPVFGDNA